MTPPAPPHGFLPGGRHRARGPAKPVPRRVLVVCCLAGLLSGCASSDAGPGYYWQSVTGHLKLMHAARPVQDWLDDPATPPALQHKLQLQHRVQFQCPFVASPGIPAQSTAHLLPQLGDAAGQAPYLSLALLQ